MELCESINNTTRAETSLKDILRIPRKVMRKKYTQETIFVYNMVYANITV